MTLKNKLYNLLVFVLLSYFAVGQKDTLNKYNKENKKDGYWLQYLDNTVSPIDSSNAYFYGYELYDNGEKVFIFYKDWWVDKGTFTYEDKLPIKGKPILLTGTFKWVDNKDQLNYSIEVYKNGQPISQIDYGHRMNDTTKEIGEYFDYTKRYNNIPGTYYYEYHFGNNRPVKKFWFRKGKRHWRSYRIND